MGSLLDRAHAAGLKRLPKGWQVGDRVKFTAHERWDWKKEGRELTKIRGTVTMPPAPASSLLLLFDGQLPLCILPDHRRLKGRSPFWGIRTYVRVSDVERI